MELTVSHHLLFRSQGFTLPGATIVCGDSHTSTHGAFGALAFGIGTSEVEHVLATQTLPQKKAKNMRIQVDGQLGPGVTSKDIVLHVIGIIGTAGGTGCVIEFCGSAIRQLSMEARMSICNMSIEGGARAGLIAPDEITFEYIKGRPLAPKAGKEWEDAVAYWKTLPSDEGAKYDVEVKIAAEDIPPTLTWGTSPQDTVAITGVVPDPSDVQDEKRAATIKRSLEYMGLTPGTPMEQVKLDKVFIGSCTNSRIEDLREAAKILYGRKIASHIYGMLVPGSGLVKKQAEAEGLDKIFTAAGFDWREAGCSMCLGMNPDQLAPGERCASTSNRNFEGRQGAGGRTHLMSPAMAAACAITGYLTDVRKFASGRVGSEADKPAFEVQVTDSKAYLGETPLHVPADTPEGAQTGQTDEDKIRDVPASTTSSAAASGGAPSGSSRKFTVLKGIAAPIDRENVDTDVLIPARFLKTVTRAGLGKSLFYRDRYDDSTGKENPDFVLNQDPWRQARIIVSRDNWGCGSSREHAAWALDDFGVSCVIAKSFADIHHNNLLKNFLLPITMSDAEQLEACMDAAKGGEEIEVDLPKKTVKLASGQSFAFEMDEWSQHCLVNALDDIELTLAKEEHIAAYEEKRRQTTPWLEGPKARKLEAKPVSKMEAKAASGKLDW